MEMNNQFKKCERFILPMEVEPFEHEGRNEKMAVGQLH